MSVTTTTERADGAFLLSRDDMHDIQSWCLRLTDTETQENVQDLLDHARTLQKLIHAPNEDPSRAQVKRMVTALRSRLRYMTTQDELGLASSHDRAEMSAMRHAAKLMTRLVAVNFAAGNIDQ